jgi:hypothetical protein
MHPRTDGGKVTIDAMPPRMELKLSAVIAVFGPHRADDRQIIDAIADVRPPVAHFNPAGAALLIADLQRQNLRAHEAVVRIKGDDPLVGQIRRSQDVFVGRLGNRLAGEFVQLRLGIKTLQMARPADHKQPDHALGPRRKMRHTRGRTPRLRRLLLAKSITREHRAERQAREAHAHIGQKRAARWSHAGAQRRRGSSSRHVSSPQSIHFAVITNNVRT